MRSIRRSFALHPSPSSDPRRLQKGRVWQGMRDAAISVHTQRKRWLSPSSSCFPSSTLPQQVSAAISTKLVSRMVPNTKLCLIVGATRPSSTQSKSMASLCHLGSSLYYALHHLRQPDQSRYLWIDAICINQEDLDERSQQVGLMRQIYSQASHVVVWLGPEADDSPVGMALAQNLCEAYHKRASAGDSRQYQHLQDGGLSAVYRLPAYRRGPDFPAFFTLFRRAWFKRWVGDSRSSFRKDGGHPVRKLNCEI